MPRDAFLAVADVVLPRVGTGEDRRDLLRGRLDAAFGRRADHPHRGDPAAAARQHRAAGRRHPGAARPRVDPGLDRHPDAVRHPARLPADADVQAATRTRSTAYIEQAPAPNAGWWHNFDKYIVILLKAWYGDAATRGERLRLRLAAADHRRPLALRLLAATWPTASCEGLFVMGQNPAVGAPNARLERRALAKLKWLVVRDMVETETATFWLDSPEVATRRAAHRRHRDRSVLLSGRRARREGRELHEHAAAAAVAREGRRAARRRAQRGLVRLSPRPPPEGEGGSAIRSPRERGAERADVELPDRRTARRAGHRARCCRRSTAARSPTARWSTASPQLKADGIDGVRLLDLLRRLSDRRAIAPNERAAARTPTDTAGASRGRPIAASSTTAPRRDPTGRRGASARSWSGGTTRQREWTGHDTPDFTQDQAARLRSRRRTTRGRRGACRRRAVHHAPRRRRLDLGPERPEGRTAAGALRAARVAGAEPSLRAADESRGRSEGASRQRVRDSPGDPRYPARADDLPADRASHGRRHVAHALASGRAAAGALLRDLAGAGDEIGVANGDWVIVTTPRGVDRGARARHRRACRPLVVQGRASTRSACRITSAARGLVTRRRRQRSRGDLRGAERADHGSRRRSCATSGGGPGTSVTMQNNDRVSHRLDALHRLQGLRGRVQGMERRSRRRLRVHRILVRQHRRRSATRRGGT